MNPTWLLTMTWIVPAGAVGRQLGQAERFRHDALPGERGVAVDQDRHDLRSARGRRGAPAWPGRFLDHRVDQFQMAGIGAERAVDLASAGP